MMNNKPAFVKIHAPEIVLDGGAAFDAEKKVVFEKIAVNRDDKSRAGDLDVAILPFVEMINSKNDYYTTSSCAGRSIVFHKVVEDKYKCDWIYLTHEIDCDVNEILVKLHDNIRDNKLVGETWFKMEPVIVAIQCRSIQAANLLLILAKSSGLKNCGIRSISTDGTVSLCLVDTQHIETLIVYENTLLITEDYLIRMAALAKEKLIKTRSRFEQLQKLLNDQLS